MESNLSREKLVPTKAMRSGVPANEGKEETDLSKAPYGTVLPQRTNNEPPRQFFEPGRSGHELELAGAKITFPKKETLTNGTMVAQTPDDPQMDGIPIFKLEVEGVVRESPCIELVCGPLPEERAFGESFALARAKLIRAIKRGGTIAEIVERYNGELAKQESKFKLSAVEAHKKYKIRPRNDKDLILSVNSQANISIPYAKIGQIGARDKQKESEYAGFEEFFTSGSGSGKEIFLKARQAANRLTGPTDFSPEVTSVMTHLMFQYGMYEMKRIAPHKEQDKDKHAFHVMIKSSVQDAIMSILSRTDVDKLYEWVSTKDNQGSLKDAYLASLDELTRRHSAIMDSPDPLLKEIMPALEARQAMKGSEEDPDGRVLLSVTDSGEPKSFKVPVTADRKDSITPLHPRLSNRIPVYRGQRAPGVPPHRDKAEAQEEEHYWIVVEQRSGGHPLNDREQFRADGEAARKRVAELVRKLQKT